MKHKCEVALLERVVPKLEGYITHEQSGNMAKICHASAGLCPATKAGEPL